MRTLVNGRDIEDLLPAERAALDRRAKARLADLFNSQQAPVIRTDATFMRGRKKGAEQFGNLPNVRETYMEPARRLGMSTDGKVYMSEIAAYPGDPRAWVDSTDDIKRVCEERGWAASGDVTVKGREKAPTPDVEVAEDIVQEHIEHEIAVNPEAARKPEATREKVVNRIKPKWKKK
jgi:hypothetical protein